MSLYFLSILLLITIIPVISYVFLFYLEKEKNFIIYRIILFCQYLIMDKFNKIEEENIPSDK